MVCLGNICRSPLAEGILKSKLSEIKSNSLVESRGFEPFHAGDEADPRSIKIASRNGLDISMHKAKLFSVEDFDNFDKIFVMDYRNFSDVATVARDEKDLEKVDLLLNMAFPNSNKVVPDPYYGGIDGFQKVWELIEKACNAIIEVYER